jgi:hypothetical protein
LHKDFGEVFMPEIFFAWIGPFKKIINFRARNEVAQLESAQLKNTGTGFTLLSEGIRLGR